MEKKIEHKIREIEDDFKEKYNLTRTSENNFQKRNYNKSNNDLTKYINTHKNYFESLFKYQD